MSWVESHTTRMGVRGVSGVSVDDDPFNSADEVNTTGKIWNITEAGQIYDGDDVQCNTCQDMQDAKSRVLHNDNTDYCMGCIFKHECNINCVMRISEEGDIELCTVITPCIYCIDRFKQSHE